MKTSIKLSDFNFRLTGHGHYNVVYTSPSTGKHWAATIDDIRLIDATKNAEEPSKVDLNKLKRACKSAQKCIGL